MFLINSELSCCKREWCIPFLRVQSPNGEPWEAWDRVKKKRQRGGTSAFQDERRRGVFHGSRRQRRREAPRSDSNVRHFSSISFLMRFLVLFHFIFLWVQIIPSRSNRDDSRLPSPSQEHPSSMGSRCPRERGGAPRGIRVM